MPYIDSLSLKINAPVKTDNTGSIYPNIATLLAGSTSIELKYKI